MQGQERRKMHSETVGVHSEALKSGLVFGRMGRDSKETDQERDVLRYPS